MSADLSPPDDRGEVHDTATGEIIPAAQRAPRVRTLDALVALANGGEYPRDMEGMIAGFFDALFRHAQDHDVKAAAGVLTMKIKASVDRYGEVDLDFRPSVVLPDPPCDDGKGRAYVDDDGTLVTHKQKDLPLMRDVSTPRPKMRDTGARKG